MAYDALDVNRDCRQYCCCIQAAHANRCMGVIETISEHVIASIIGDSLSGMNYVAFRTDPPIGGLSC